MVAELLNTIQIAQIDQIDYCDLRMSDPVASFINHYFVVSFLFFVVLPAQYVLNCPIINDEIPIANVFLKLFAKKEYE